MADHGGPSLPWARDFMECARASALALHALDMKHQSLMTAAQLGAQSYAERRATATDPHAALDELLDFENALDGLRAPHRAVLDDATEILYGPRARCGVAKLLGHKYADVLCWRFLQVRRWREIAADLGCSVRWAQELANTALDWMDSTGEAHIRAANDNEEEFIESVRDGG